MRQAKRKRLEAAGWRVGSAQEFLGLSEQEAAFVEVKSALGTYLRRYRAKRGLTQTALAQRIGSSQSRVAKMEAGDPTVSLDLQVRALLTLGATPRDLAKAFSAAVASAKVG
jgi:DNA-binding XRE family transcriptional regulator